MLNSTKEYFQMVFTRDPAARNALEIIFCYPGVHALWFHRVVHFLWASKFRFLARFLANGSRFLTGIDIHPGAIIGKRFFIDHGSGVVIGETAVIGDDVLMYQGAILGGTSLKKGKRHPTIGNNVVIGAESVVLGAVSIGDNAKIGSGSVVLKSVPSGATVVGVPGRIVKDNKKPFSDLEHGDLPDPVAEVIRLIFQNQEELKKRLEKVEKRSRISVQTDKPIITHKRITEVFGYGEGI